MCVGQPFILAALFIAYGLGMTPEVFNKEGLIKLAELQKKYHLAEWFIYLWVVEQKDLGGENCAECTMDETRRVANLSFSRPMLSRQSDENIWATLEHEVQHIVFYPLEELEKEVMAAVDYLIDATADDDGDGGVFRHSLQMKFTRTHELLRSALGRVTKAGNNWDVT
jgi:hypothetical protein